MRGRSEGTSATEPVRAAQRRSHSTVREYAESLIVAVLLALAIRTFVVQAFVIPSGSMLPTLQIGDYLLVNKLAYTFRPIQRGDIIVFKFPRDESQDFIKRVVGLPGDKIEIRKGTLFINDQPVPIIAESAARDSEQAVRSPYYEKPKLFMEQLGGVKHQIQYLRDQSGLDFLPKLVPADSVFVMGDNRDNSQDSRVWGFVKYDKILGRALIIYWSWDGDERWIRWERIGRLIR